MRLSVSLIPPVHHSINGLSREFLQAVSFIRFVTASGIDYVPAECPQDIMDRLGGWSVGGVGETYGSGYPIEFCING